MIDLVVVGLLSMIAGDPVVAEQPAEPSTQEQIEAAPVAEATPSVETAAEPRLRRERRCEEVEVTGRRMPRRVCQNVWVPADEPAED